MAASTIDAMAMAMTNRRAAPRSTRSRRDGCVRPGKGDDRQRRRSHRGQDRQGGLRDDVGQARRPEVERDGSEAHRDRDREGEIGESEDDGLGRELAQVAPEPGGRGDGQCAGDDDRTRLADAHRRAGAPVAGDERHQHPEQSAGGGREDGRPGIHETQGQAARGEDG